MEKNSKASFFSACWKKWSCFKDDTTNFSQVQGQ